MTLFHVFPNFPFTANEMMVVYYLDTLDIRVSSRVGKLFKTQDLRKLGNIGKFFKVYRMIAQFPVSMRKLEFCSYQQKTLEKQSLNFSGCVLFHMKIRVTLKYFVSYCLWKDHFILACPQTLSTLTFLIFFVTLRSFTLF